MLKRKLPLLTLLFALFISTAIQVKAQNLRDAYTVENFALNSPDAINVSTSGGFVRVLGSDRNDVQVEMYVRQRNRYLDSSDNSLDEFDIDISQKGSTINVSAERESSGWRFWRNNSNISVSFIIRTPSNTRVDARTSGGSMLADNINGNVSLRTSGGSISLTHVDGNIDLHTSGGSISIEDSNGRINGNTSGGSISVENTSGTSEVRTSGGNIRLTNLNGSVSARTSGGNVQARMVSVSGDIDLRTSGGNISIDLPADNGYDLDLSGNGVNSELSNFSGEISRGHISGTINGGGHKISARTSGGSVRINSIQ